VKRQVVFTGSGGVQCVQPYIYVGDLCNACMKQCNTVVAALGLSPFHFYRQQQLPVRTRCCAALAHPCGSYRRDASSCLATFPVV